MNTVAAWCQGEGSKHDLVTMAMRSEGLDTGIREMAGALRLREPCPLRLPDTGVHPQGGESRKAPVTARAVRQKRFLRYARRLHT